MLLSESDGRYTWKVSVSGSHVIRGRFILPTSTNMARVAVIVSICSPISIERSWIYR
jgi:hypothetical protein